VKNKRKIIIILILLLTLTGCTKQLTDVDGKQVINTETGQILPSNILCQPESQEILDIYNNNNEELLASYQEKYDNGDISKKEYEKKVSNLIDIESLPVCSEYKITSGSYEGVWNSIFVKPLAWLIIQFGKVFKYGLAIILTTLLIRLVIYPFTRKALHQNENLTKAKPELDKIEKKYQNKQDQQSLQMKSQEMLAVYNKYDIKPLSGCLMSFIQIPLFFAYYEALYRLPALFEDNFLGFNLAMTPWTALTNGNYIYIILPILVLLVTYYSFKISTNQSLGEQQNQMKLIMKISVIMVFVMAFNMSSAIIIYWISNSTFTIIQNLLVKKVGKNHD
jgi:YidC/Oxa1 family membrane protein insertase